MRYFLVLLLFLLTVFVENSAFCEVDLPSSGCQQRVDDCEYYFCRENLQECGPSGYFKRFAHPYCSLFMEEVGPRLSSDESREWLARVGQCLREKMEKTIPVVSGEVGCRETEEKAIATHFSCYVDKGFCQIGSRDKIRIFRTIYRELSNPKMFKVFLEIGKACVGVPTSSL